jgi:hypothetical protein
MQDEQLANNTGRGHVSPKSSLALKPVGSSIPVSKNCAISVSATGEVTQKGIKKLMDYLNLINDSFPEDEEAAQKPN